MIRVRRDGALAELVLDRPQAGNALDRAAVSRLRTALDGIEAELLVVRGAGGRGFCGGIDSREVLGLPPEDRRDALRAFAAACSALWEHPALTVAVLDGYAIGGGAHLAMACDLRAFAPAAFIQFPAGRYGLGLTATWLTLVAGPATASALLASARRVGAEEARALGLADAVADGDDALPALGIATADGLRDTKAAVRAALPPHVPTALAAEHRRAVERIGDDRFVTALAAETR